MPFVETKDEGRVPPNSLEEEDGVVVDSLRRDLPLISDLVNRKPDLREQLSLQLSLPTPRHSATKSVAPRFK